MTRNKTALIMGVANRRSIAWACVRSFLEHDYNVIFTYQNERFKKTAENLIESCARASCHPTTTTTTTTQRIRALPCNVESEIPLLFQQGLPELLSNDNVSLDAIVHSIAYAPNMKESSLLTTSREDFCMAHDVSAYSFLEVAQYSNTQSLTALSYLGAVRAVPHYSVMGPCKASLESLVRGLALELGSRGTRVNAVSSGPLSTISGRGITGLSEIQADVELRAPLKRNITADEVADTVRFIATQATGITGQTIYVDGGYSIVAGPVIPS
jgi:enoyl-[acyl-carrier protein] reductase I